MRDQSRKARMLDKLEPPQQGTWKFNIDGSSKEKSGLTGIRGVLRNHKGESSIMFNESVCIKDSNEAEILSIRRALVI